MNEIALAAVVDEVEAITPPDADTAVTWLHWGMTAQEAELANLELERRGCPNRVVPVIDVKIEATYL